MREADLWERVRKRLPDDVFARRIEDASGNLGTFDTFLAQRDRGAAWLELKVAGRRAKPDLRPGQPAFAAQCFDVGVPAAYLVGSRCGYARLIGPMTNGEDWRDHVVAEWQIIDVRAILAALFSMYDAPQWPVTRTPPPVRDFRPTISPSLGERRAPMPSRSSMRP